MRRREVKRVRRVLVRARMAWGVVPTEARMARALRWAGLHRRGGEAARARGSVAQARAWRLVSEARRAGRDLHYMAAVDAVQAAWRRGGGVWP